MRTRRLYRARAWYSNGSGEYAVTRHFQTRSARDGWADQRREGYPEVSGDHLTWAGPEDSGRAAIPPALRVETADSDPITFPEDGSCDR